MSDIIRLHGNKHSEIQQILPWYAAGTLEPQDRAHVDAHLEGCADCQAELRLDHRLRGVISELPLDVEQGWAALRRQMGSEAAERRPATHRLARIFAIFGRPLKLGWFVAAEAAFAAFALVVIGHPAVPHYYRAMATPQLAAAGNVIVIFRSDEPERAMRAALLASRARIVDGPTAAGAYILSIPADRTAGLARLRGTAGVALAEPLDSDTPQ
jgi:anti-sigma factor RsiW